MNKKIKQYLDKKIDTNFKGKTVLITGANSGIGFEVANQLLYLGANVIMACRNLEKAEMAKSLLLQQNPLGKVDIFQLDLADLRSIETFIEELKKSEIEVDIFYNNAGVFGIPKSTTKQGKEIVLGTNLIGTYYLNKLLLQNFSAKMRIIFTTSITAHLFKINYKDPYLEKHYKKFKIYGSSKRGIVQIWKYFSENNKSQKFALVHPGITYTSLIDKAYSKNWFRKVARGFMKVVFHSAEKAALSTVKLMDDQNSVYYGPRGLFGISGFPKKKKVPVRLQKHYYETVGFIEDELQK